MSCRVAYVVAFALFIVRSGPLGGWSIDNQISGLSGFTGIDGMLPKPCDDPGHGSSLFCVTQDVGECPEGETVGYTLQTWTQGYPGVGDEGRRFGLW